MTFSISTNLAANQAVNHFILHYSQLSKSINRLSTGLRIAGASDDAAGLAVRETMRAEIAAMKQGVRNTNDAISMIQTADGALAVINEKIIRMKELAEQAATGTYTSIQRQIMDEEFQAMKDEINRIANSTSFNDIKLLNADKNISIHFGPENRDGIDGYDVQLGDSTVDGLGLVDRRTVTETSIIYSEIPLLSDVLINDDDDQVEFQSGIVSFARISAGTRNLFIHMYSGFQNDSMQVFTPDGVHVLGTELGTDVWTLLSLDEDDVNTQVITEENAFNPEAVYDGSVLNGTGGNISYTGTPPYNEINYNGTTFNFSGNGHPSNYNEYLQVQEVNEDLVLMIIGTGQFLINASWDDMPVPMDVEYSTVELGLNILTQDNAQRALETIDEALIKKDSLRARLGATQNRLENTARVQTITIENLKAAESRISDVDVALEMTNFLNHQIKSNVAIAILSQANMLPQMAMQLLGR